MAQGTLVDSLIQDGLELIDDLLRGNVPVSAAWWAKVIPETSYMGDRPEWQLFLASSLVDHQGPRVAYQKAVDALRTSPRGDPILARISVSMIKIIGETDPLTIDVYKIIKHHSSKPPIYVSRCRLGGIEVEDVYIFYVSTLPAPWQKVKLKADAEITEPLSPRKKQTMSQIVASGIDPQQLGVWEIRPKQRIAAGTIVDARVIGAEDDPDPLLLFTLPDGRQRITHKRNTEPVSTSG
jgi:hypothetical protein